MTLKELADVYPQLYLTPKQGESESQEYKDIVLRGKKTENHELSGFITTKEDKIFDIDTPAGTVKIVYLANRNDFERFITIMFHRCEPIAFPKTMGASTITGINNWRKIEDHKLRYLATKGDNWDLEFENFTKDPQNFKDTIVVLSKGGYSGIDCTKVGYTEEEWSNLSFRIRLYHECTHVICRRLYPDNINNIFDEILADCMGLIFALGYYDTELAKLFLGVSETGYTGGRLENYIDDAKQQKNIIDKVAKKVTSWIIKLSEEVKILKDRGFEGFSILLQIEDNIDKFI